MRMGIFFSGIILLRGEPLSTQKPTQSLACQAAMREVMRQTFKYDPTVRKKAEEEGLLDNDVIRLEPFFVNEKKVSPYLVSDLDRKRELFEANKPSLSNGIRKSITPNVSVGVMPSSPNSAPCWTLLNIRL